MIYLSSIYFCYFKVIWKLLDFTKFKISFTIQNRVIFKKFPWVFVEFSEIVTEILWKKANCNKWNKCKKMKQNVNVPKNVISKKIVYRW